LQSEKAHLEAKETTL